MLVADSAADVIAAHAAGIKAIGYANKFGKADQLCLAKADAVTDSLTVIVQAVRNARNRL